MGRAQPRLADHSHESLLLLVNARRVTPPPSSHKFFTAEHGISYGLSEYSFLVFESTVQVDLCPLNENAMLRYTQYILPTR
jgi:hypothetical protein